MEDRIVVRASAETDTAEAFVEKVADKEERLIFYNAEFMASVARKDKNYLSMVAILAHEVGHHIRMHTVIPGRESGRDDGGFGDPSAFAAGRSR